MRCAVIFALTIIFTSAVWAAKEKILYSFTGGNDGSGPYSTLIFDQKGNLYGTTAVGGFYGDGTVFELSPNSNGSWTESVLYSFGAYAGDGTGPDDNSGLVFDIEGNLYGTTASGGNSSACPYGADSCGTVFELTPNQGGGWKESILYNFSGGSDGASPGGGVVLDKSGNLYGMTEVGGNLSACSGGCGTVFKLSPKHGGWNFSVLHAFSETDGGYPFTGLSLAPSGLLWGTTNSGGAGTGGVVFNLKRDGSEYRVVYNFQANQYDQTQPGLSTLAFGKTGHVFGTTRSGCNRGTAFMLFPSGRHNYKLKTIACFSGGGDGDTPWGGLLLSPFGHLYGITLVGGTNACDGGGGCGTAYRLVWSKGRGWKETVLYRFQGGTDGYYPVASLVMDATGNLYGITSQGGTYNAGTVFEITP